MPDNADALTSAGIFANIAARRPGVFCDSASALASAAISTNTLTFSSTVITSKAVTLSPDDSPLKAA